MTQTQPPGGPPNQYGLPEGAIPHQAGPPPAGLGPQGYPPPSRSTNGLAVAALVLGILLAPIGLILGVVALVQIRKRDQGGWVATEKARQALDDAARGNFPDIAFTTTCADGKEVVVGWTGTTIECVLASTEGPTNQEQHRETTTSDNGDISIE